MVTEPSSGCGLVAPDKQSAVGAIRLPRTTQRRRDDDVEAACPSLLLVAKQPELRCLARGFGNPEMAEGMRGQKAPARGALQIAALD
jgi:hypothetical protein